MTLTRPKPRMASSQARSLGRVSDLRAGQCLGCTWSVMVFATALARSLPE